MRSLILLLIAAPILASAQPLMFEEVVYPGDSTETKEELYNRAKSWFMDAFKNPNKVIQLDDMESGVITGKGTSSFSTSFLMGSSASGNIQVTVSLYLKDGRYKYVLSDFNHQDSNWNFGLILDTEIYPYQNTTKGFTRVPDKTFQRVWDELLPSARVLGVKLAKSIKSHMAQPTEMEVDDW